VLLFFAGWGLFVVAMSFALFPRRPSTDMDAPTDYDWPLVAVANSAVVARIPSRGRPTVFAVGMALISWPIVALTLGAVDTSGKAFNPELASPATALGLWSAAGSGVLLSALVAGTIGGPLVRRHAGGGWLLTFVLALIVAIPGLTIAPALLGQNVGAGCENIEMAGPCTEYIVKTGNLFQAVWSDALFWLAPVYEPIPVFVLAVGVAVWTALVRRLPQS
jgi:hypothetical protein